MTVDVVVSHNASYGYALHEKIPKCYPGFKVAEFGLVTPSSDNHVQLTGSATVRFTVTGTIKITIRRDGATIYTTRNTGRVPTGLTVDQTIAFNWEDVLTTSDAGFHVYDLFVTLNDSGGAATLIDQFSLSGTIYV